MAKNIKERKEYAYLHGISDYVPISVRKKWNRRNFDKGSFSALKKAKTERIIDIETKEEIRVIEMWEHIDYDDGIVWDKQGEFCNDYCCTVNDENIVKKYVVNY